MASDLDLQCLPTSHKKDSMLKSVKVHNGQSIYQYVWENQSDYKDLNKSMNLPADNAFSDDIFV